MGHSAKPKNVWVAGHRTSIRLENEFWEALEEICSREGQTVNDFCSEVARDNDGTNLTSAIRVCIIEYFRAKTERGDMRIAH